MNVGTCFGLSYSDEQRVLVSNIELLHNPHVVLVVRSLSLNVCWIVFFFDVK